MHLQQSIRFTRRLLRCSPEYPLMAQSGHPDRAPQCPLSGVKRTSTQRCRMSETREAEQRMLQERKSRRTEGNNKLRVRLAMIAPFGAAQRYNGPTRSQLSNASYQQIAA